MSDERDLTRIAATWIVVEEDVEKGHLKDYHLLLVNDSRRLQKMLDDGDSTPQVPGIPPTPQQIWHSLMTYNTEDRMGVLATMTEASMAATRCRTAHGDQDRRLSKLSTLLSTAMASGDPAVIELATSVANVMAGRDE